jgi:hypothetical protein
MHDNANELVMTTPPKPIKPNAFSPLPGSMPVPLLRATGCRWPVSDHPFLFCDKSMPVGRSFCDAHHKLAYPATITSRGKK